MKINGKKIIFFFFTLLTLLLGAGSVYSQSCETVCSRGDTGCLSQVISDCGSKVTLLKGQANTLKNQIAQFDAQIKLATLKISQTEEKISQLGGRIDQLEVSLASLTKAFASRAVETYKMSKVENNIFYILTADNLDDAVSRFHYLQRIQEADRSLLERLELAQTVYEGEKLDQEELQKQLETQKKSLNSQKAAKNALLSQTQNDEKKYQSLLNQALAEKAAIEKALANGVKVGPVKAGDPIGLVGNSGYPGCSSGKHLHFEVRKNNVWTDPSPYLQNKSVIDEQVGGGNVAVGSGNWPWPIQDTVRMTQHYGNTPYSWRYVYSGGIHTGLDLVSTTSDVIKAPADGDLYKSSESCGSSSIINIVYIDHGGGLLTFYLHVQ